MPDRSSTTRSTNLVAETLSRQQSSQTKSRPKFSVRPHSHRLLVPTSLTTAKKGCHDLNTRRFDKKTPISPRS